MSLLIDHLYHFGEFTVDADQRVLLRGGKPQPLAPKVFDTLLVLIENSGRIVLKEELMKRLWPDTFVEEANLSFNIQQLRKSLGDNARKPHYIETIARRGYRFIAGVEEVLSGSGGGRIAEQLKPSNNSASATVDLKNEVVVPALKHTCEVSNETQLPVTEGVFDMPATADAVAASAGKRFVAIVGVVVLVPIAFVLVSWKILTRASKGPGENQGVVRKSPGEAALKLEELTRTGQSRYVAVSPDGKYVAYTRGSDSRSGVWLRQLATNTNVEIVPANGTVHGLVFANNGEYLYFVGGDPSALYRVSLLGGVPAKIVDRPEGKVAISFDDRQIAFIRQVINREGQREYSLIIANADGGNERTLLVTAHPDELDAPLWSPDGQSIICAYGNPAGGSQEVSIVEVRVSDGMKKTLSSDRFNIITKMAWLPDKTGLIMAARKKSVDNELWRASYPGMQISQITEGVSHFSDLSIAANADVAAASQTIRTSNIWVSSSPAPQDLKWITQATDNFCWTPGGELVYSSRASGNADLWIMHSDGTEQKQLTVNAATNGTPAITPDNRYIVFMSNRTGALQVWRMNIDGSNQIQLTNGSGSNYPAVSPDGKWVLYNSTEDWHLWKVSIDGGKPVRLTDYVASAPAVSHDGRMIACVGRNDAKRELLILPFEGGPPVTKASFFGWISRIHWMNDGKVLVYGGERNGVRALMKQSLNGGLTEEPLNFNTEELFDFGYSADGRLAVTRGGWQHDIVLISGLNQY